MSVSAASSRGTRLIRLPETSQRDAGRPWQRAWRRAISLQALDRWAGLPNTDAHQHPRETTRRGHPRPRRTHSSGAPTETRSARFPRKPRAPRGSSWNTSASPRSKSPSNPCRVGDKPTIVLLPLGPRWPGAARLLAVAAATPLQPYDCARLGIPNRPSLEIPEPQHSHILTRNFSDSVEKSLVHIHEAVDDAPPIVAERAVSARLAHCCSKLGAGSQRANRAAHALNILSRCQEPARVVDVVPNTTDVCGNDRQAAGQPVEQRAVGGAIFQRQEQEIR